MNTDPTPRRPADFTWRVLLALVIVDTALWLSLPLWW
jgi:hypothetical protein